MSGFQKLESNRGLGFVDCDIVFRCSLGRRVIGRMYSAKCADIVLELKRNGPSSLCILSGENHGSEDPGHMDLGRNEAL